MARAENPKSELLCGHCRERPVRSPTQWDCSVCHAAAVREARKKTRLSPVQKAHARALAYLNWQVRQGKLKRGPCAQCGLPETSGWIADPSKPLLAEWLCHDHLQQRRLAAKSTSAASSSSEAGGAHLGLADWRAAMEEQDAKDGKPPPRSAG